MIGMIGTTNMIGPSWLATIIGILSLATTAAAALRIVGAWRTGLATDYAVEICHGVMGVSMAGMLIPKLHIVTPGVGAGIWLVVSCLITAWFAVSVVRDGVASSVSRPGRPWRLPRLPHVPHLVLSGAMVYMLAVTLVMSDSSESEIAGMSMNAGGMPMSTDLGEGSTLTPAATLNLLLAFFVVGYTVLLIDRFPLKVPPRGSACSGTQHRADTEVPVFSPRSAALLRIATSFSMTYMLVMMFA